VDLNEFTAEERGRYAGMKRTLVLVGIVLILAVIGVMAFADLDEWSPFRRSPAPPAAKTASEKRVLGVLDEMERAGKTYLSVGALEGRMLRLVTEAAGAKSVVEIGTSTGYSGLWFCLALQNTGGRLTTFEIDPGRAAMAREHFRKAGVGQLVTIVEGDAHQNISQLTAPIDVVFIDADKDGYLDYLNKLLPLVRPGGLILADNVSMAPEYVKAISTNPELETLYYSDGKRLGISLKKR
jgi:predicted O-methyltransferase YrrM